MEKYFTLAFLVFATITAKSQTNNGVELEINYGFSYNPSADYFFETNDPPRGYTFYDKNKSGKISGAEIRLPISKSMSLGLAFNHSVHSRRVNFIPENIPIYVQDFRIRNFYNFYQLVVQKNFERKSHIFSVSTGLYYQRVAWQDISASINGLGLEERNFKNDGLEEAGVFLGFQYSRKIDTHFYLGIKSRIYSTISAGASIDGITLTPALYYQFAKTKKKG